MPDGAILDLEDGTEAWLPALEWSSSAKDWAKESDSIEPGDDLCVWALQSMPVHSRLVVSRRQLPGRMVDESLIHRPKIMHVTEMTRRLIRGSIGFVSCIAEQQRYLDYLSTKRLAGWASDHAVIGPGDVIGGIVVGILDGQPELDIAGYLARLEQEAEVEARSARARSTTTATREMKAASGANPPAAKLDSGIAEQISPVLLVENELSCREAIKAILEDEKVVVQIARDTAQAHQLLAENPPFPLVVIDLNLNSSAHDQNGFGIITTLQNIPNSRVLLMTGEDFGDAKRTRWGHLEVNGCLLKPFDSEELCQAINAIVKTPRESWPTLIDGGSLPNSEEARSPVAAVDPRSVSAQEAIDRLAAMRAGSVVHVFAVHDRSFRSRSVLSANGAQLNWLSLRGKIAKSPIKDTAFSQGPIDVPASSPEGTHFWTRQMMNYQSFYGVPAHIPGSWRHALVIFHPEQRAFDEQFKFSARLCAEQVGRALERETLVRNRSQEVAHAVMGMTFESLAHELKSEISGMINFSRIAGGYLANVRTLDDDQIEKAGAAAAHLQRSSVMTHEIVKALLGVRAAHQPVDPWGCLRIAARRCRQISNDTLDNPASIRIDYPPDQSPLGPLTVKATTAALTIVLFNLFLNAAQQIDQTITYGIRQSGRIWSSWEVRTSDKGVRMLLIRVHDTGPGIHASDWERIFEPGYSTKEGGTGLGLYISKQLLAGISERGRKATLNVTRSVLLAGATFTLALPLTSQ